VLTINSQQSMIDRAQHRKRLESSKLGVFMGVPLRIIHDGLLFHVILSASKD
jgi:hypothetical protein